MALKHLLSSQTRAWLYWRRAKTLAVFKKIGHRLGLGKFIWKISLPTEVGFWDEYLATRGKSCAAEAEFNFRTDPAAELQPWLREWLNCPAGSQVRILDVGAGPLSWVGKKWPERQVVLQAIDPLADSYRQIMERNNINPPVVTMPGDGEEVVKRFGAGVFDLTFARNCLDHSYDAIRAVTNMIEATKPGGVIFLWHNQDEAEHLSYEGLHQWNFRLEKNELVVWRNDRRMNVNQVYAQQLQVLRCELRDGMIQAVYRKIAG
jgi:SAM-dependent methyltransferase